MVNQFNIFTKNLGNYYTKTKRIIIIKIGGVVKHITIALQHSSYITGERIGWVKSPCKLNFKPMWGTK